MRLHADFKHVRLYLKYQNENVRPSIAFIRCDG